jgi:hypothetical protein
VISATGRIRPGRVSGRNIERGRRAGCRRGRSARGFVQGVGPEQTNSGIARIGDHKERVRLSGCAHRLWLVELGLVSTMLVAVVAGLRGRVVYDQSTQVDDVARGRYERAHERVASIGEQDAAVRAEREPCWLIDLDLRARQQQPQVIGRPVVATGARPDNGRDVGADRSKDVLHRLLKAMWVVGRIGESRSRGDADSSSSTCTPTSQALHRAVQLGRRLEKVQDGSGGQESAVGYSISSTKTCSTFIRARTQPRGT